MRGRASLLEEVSYETLVLETWRFTFGGSLVRNDRFGDLALHSWRKSRTKRSFWRKSRTKRSFWRLGASLLEEVSYETLVLETWRFTFGGSLVRNAPFGGSLVRNAHFGDLALHLWSWTPKHAGVNAACRLGGAVPLGSAKHAGVSAVRCW